ncbi:hypothetical protein OEZ86_004380 [Tetradesmus obliquus]|nr:hypothetical protein OEZ86_004380 [Tetradesmus obliquus]
MAVLQQQPAVAAVAAAAAAASSGGGSSSSSSCCSSSSSSSSSRSSSISDTSLRYGELWLAVTSALGAVLDCALTLNAADDANGEQEKTLLQLLQLLIQSGLQLHLPEFLGQAVKLLPASGQRLVCRPLSAAVKLMRVIAVLLTSHPFGYSDSASFWPWAKDTVCQLLICGVAAGLLQPPAGGSAAEAAALLRRAASSRSSSNGRSSSSRNDSSSSSSSAGEAVVALQLQLCDDISKGAESLVALAMRVMLPMRSGVTASGKLCCHFITRPEMSLLWRLGQWQPQMQLLQQGGGQMLLQGLSLAVHCGSLDAFMRKEHLSVPELMDTVQLFEAGSERDAMHTRRPLFTSQLARKHLVPFFQFADICASPGGSSQQQQQHL